VLNQVLLAARLGKHRNLAKLFQNVTGLELRKYGFLLETQTASSDAGCLPLWRIAVVAHGANGHTAKHLQYRGFCLRKWQPRGNATMPLDSMAAVVLL
jgi:hypothetical protein